jgi:hypothetical protein
MQRKEQSKYNKLFTKYPMSASSVSDKSGELVLGAKVHGKHRFS